MNLKTLISSAQQKVWDDALVGLLQLFRTTPHPRVAALVAEMSALAEKGLPAIEGKNLDARVAAAERLLAEGNPRDLPRVLRLFRDVRLAQADRLVKALADVPSDPRILDAALLLLRDPPFSSSTSMPFWRAFLAFVDGQQDPRTRPALAALDFSWLADWSAESFRTAIARLGTPKGKKRGEVQLLSVPELSKDQAAACDAIEAAIGRAAGDGDALLAAVRATPDDDAPRAVYADWLEEQGNPRGQLIALQLATRDRAPTEDERKAIKALLDKHQDTWLGELGDVLHGERTRFQRGFLAVASVTTEELPRLAANADAATIECLWLTVRDAFDASLLRAGNLRGLRFVGGLEPIAFGALAATGPFPFTGVGFDLFDVVPNEREDWTDERRAMRDELLRLRPTFPHAKELAIRAFHRDPAKLAFLWSSAWAEGLERLRLSSIGGAAHWIAHQDELPASVSLLEVSFDFGFHAWTTELARDREGRLSRVVATLRPKSRDFGAVSLDDIVSALLDEIAPDVLTELEVRADGVRVTEAALDAITAAARRHTRLSSLRLPGRPPLDVTKATSETPVLTTRDRGRQAHEAAARTLVERVRALVGSAPAFDLAHPSGLEHLRSLFPTNDVDARWADVALDVLAMPEPPDAPDGYGWARRTLLQDALRLYARVRPERPFTRLRPHLGGLGASRTMNILEEHSWTLVAPDELPVLLEWFESLRSAEASYVCSEMATVVLRLATKSTHADLQRRLADHKLNRFHRYAYEQITKSTKKLR